MAFELILSVSAQSDQEDAFKRFRTITEKGAKDINIEWSEPEKSTGISEHLYQILGTIGVLSLPVSVFSSALANEITRFIHGMQKVAKSGDKISFTLANMDSGETMHIEFSSRDQVIVEAVAERIRAFLV